MPSLSAAEAMVSFGMRRVLSKSARTSAGHVAERASMGTLGYSDRRVDSFW